MLENEKQKDPAFLFYSNDFYEGTRTMLPEERACYIDLMIYQHQHDFIPNDIKRIALYCSGVSEATLIATLKAKFVHTESGWINKKLQTVILKRENYINEQSIKGTNGQFFKKAKKLLTEKEYEKLKKLFENKTTTQIYEQIKDLEINKATLITKLKLSLSNKENENEIIINNINNKEEIIKEETETKKPLNDEIGLLEQRSYADLAEYTKNNELWIEAICMNLKLKKETVLNELKHFPIAQKALGRESTDLRNFKEHFNHYLAKKANELRTAENNKANSENTEVKKMMQYKADYMASVKGGKK